jgi:hypothetical protein
MGEIFKRIDQAELEKLGMACKKDLSSEAAIDLHDYSML